MTAATSASPPGPAARRVYAWSGGVLAVLGVVQLLSSAADALAWPALLATTSAGAAVAMLPRAIVPSVVVLGAAVILLVSIVEVPVFATFLGVMVAAFTLARYAGPLAALAGYSALLGTVVVVAVPELRASGDGVFAIVYPVFYFGGAGALGWLLRQRARHVAALVAYAEVLERQNLQQAELAAVAERERLAREMHDVVSHGVSLMVLQAEAAREVLHRRPDDAATALDAIAEAGRLAMADLHRMLDVLRAPDTDLVRLVVSVRATGLPVDLDVEGDWPAVPDHVRVALFRVAQESLTNAMRHARGVSTVVVRVCCGSTVTLEVVDDGLGPARPGQGTGQPRGRGEGQGSGSGLRGLRERVAAVGGDLDVGPRRDSTGFRVLATVPEGRA